MRRLLRKLADRVLGPNPYQQGAQEAPPIPPAPTPPAHGEDVMAWGVANAPALFARAREADRRMREINSSSTGDPIGPMVDNACPVCQAPPKRGCVDEDGRIMPIGSGHVGRITGGGPLIIRHTGEFTGTGEGIFSVEEK